MHQDKEQSETTLTEKNQSYAQGDAKTHQARFTCDRERSRRQTGVVYAIYMYTQPQVDMKPQG